MSFNIAVLLLGTSLGDKNNNLNVAKAYVCEKVGKIIESSIILENEAIGFTTENTFLNQTITVETHLSPFELLDTVKAIEKIMGRTYTPPKEGEKYIDRIIDIDILFFNKIRLTSNRLSIPHHQVTTREFVKKLLFIKILRDNSLVL